MTWAEYHTVSEQAASRAEMLLRLGRREEAISLYRAAAEAEAHAFAALDIGKTRTLGITAVSAVALWFKAHEYSAAEQLAHRWLAAIDLPPFAVDQLRTLLQTLWTTEAAERAGVRFVSGDVLVSIKGGKVVYGGAPLDLIVRKVEEVQAVFFRTAEMLLGLPLRLRGGPASRVQQSFTPWLFQVPAGSYQFAVRVQEPVQTDLFPDARPQVEQVTKTFLAIVKASTEDAGVKLAEVVPDKGYRNAFLKLTRNLAPTGKSFEHLEIRDAGEPASPSIYLDTTSRSDINAALRKERPPSQLEEETRALQLKGVLRAVHLDQDWLELAIEDQLGQHVRVRDVGEVLDDVIGPMVNRRVVVSSVLKGPGYYSFRDIETEE